MIVCPVCKFRNPDANERCFKCSALLKRNHSIFKESGDLVKRRSFRDRMSLRLWTPFDWLRHRGWFQRLFGIPEDAPLKYPFTAGLLSLIVPGAGHVYAGQSPKALLIFTIGISLLVFALVTLKEPWSNYVLAGLVAFYLLVWTDSVAVTTRANGNPWRPRKTLALLFAAAMLFGVSVSALQFFGSGLFTLEKLSSNAMRPHLHSGDRLLFSFVPLWFRDPRPGEVVMFHPERFVATQKTSIYSVLVRKYYQRVVGVAGDRVAKQGDVFYRNGKVVPQGLVPWGGERLPDFEIVVPPDSYFIPVTGIPRDWLSGLKGAGNISYVGQPGYTFVDFPKHAIVHEDKIRAKGIAVLNPPVRRKWL